MPVSISMYAHGGRRLYTTPVVSGPVVTSAVVNAAGDQVTVTFSEAVEQGGHTNTPVANLAAGDVTLTYVSGAGTNQRVYSPSRTITRNDVGTISYTQLGDGYKALGDGLRVQSFAGFTLTNNSTVPTVLGQVVETDTALPIVGGSIAVGQVVETDTALSISSGSGFFINIPSLPANATGWIAYWDTAGGPPYANSSGVLGTGVVGYTPAGLTNGVTYYCSYRVVDESGLAGPYQPQLQKVYSP